jgi:hypothetical protein
VEKGKFVSGELVILQACPECVLLKSRQDDYDTQKKALTKAGKSEAEVRAQTETLSNFVRTHNRDFKWYINVKNLDGTFETKKVPGKVKKQVDTLIADMLKRRQPIDAISAEQGLFFVVTKSGKGIGTEYSTKVLMEEVTRDGETYERPKLAPLTEQEYVSAQEKCRDLVDVNIRLLPLEKVQMLVDSGGDPEVIEAVFKSSEKVDAPAPKAAPVNDSKDPAPKAETVTPKAAPPKAEVKVETVTPKAAPPKTLSAGAAKLAEANRLAAAAKAAAEAAAAAAVQAAAEDNAAEAAGPADQDFDSFAAGFATEG